jgi:hypothetical protein
MMLDLLNRTPALRIARRMCLMLLAAGCGGDSPTEPAEASPAMSFTYTGAEFGSFAVTGLAGPAQAGAVGVKFGEPPRMLFVSGRQMRTSTQVDFLDLVLPEVSAPGTFSLADDCGASLENCPMGFVGIDQPLEVVSEDPDTEPDQGFFVFTSGTVTVTKVSATRIGGTFQGTAETLTFQSTPRVITITNGKFDVPLMSLDDLD